MLRGCGSSDPLVFFRFDGLKLSLSFLAEIFRFRTSSTAWDWLKLIIPNSQSSFMIEDLNVLNVGEFI